MSRIVASWFAAASAAARLVAWRLSRGAYRRRERRPVLLGWQGETVRIERDAAGTPCVRAATPAGASFGHGYAAAIDRLWQMDLLRRQALGCLSEVFGEATLDSDRLHRTLAIGHHAAQGVPAPGTPQRQALEAYCDGVNAAIGELQARPFGMPVEFGLLGCRPEAWRPVDSVAVLKLMSLQLGMNARYKALMHELLRRVAPEQASDLAARARSGDYVTCTARPRQADGAARPLQLHNGWDLAPLLGQLGQSRATGSNAWVVDGRHTADGLPMLCNDPHLPFGSPALLHQAQLVCTSPSEGFDAVGVNVPGLPGLIAGHNHQIAWGITNSQVDVQDLAFLQQGAPPPAFAPFEPAVRTEMIGMRGGAAQTLEVRITSAGPALNGLCEAGPGETLALAWSGLLPGRDMDSLLALHRARDWPGFRAALSGLQSLSLNVFFASRQGDIAFKTTGRVPRRAHGVRHTPGPLDWQGYLSFDELPECLNPPGGIIVNGNNPITEEAEGRALTVLWNPSHRAQRIHALLEGRTGLRPEDMRAIQQDELNLLAQDLLPGLLALLAPSRDRCTPGVAHALDLLGAWDHRDRADAVAPLLWHRYFNALTQALYGHRMAGLLPYFENATRATTWLLQEALAARSSAWLAGRDTLAALAGQALADVVDALPAPPHWPAWGGEHHLGFRHPLSAQLGALRRWTDLPPRARGGSAVTVALHAGSPGVVEGPVWRMVAAFTAAGTVSEQVLLPGQSGDFRSRWYGDQFDHRGAGAGPRKFTPAPASRTVAAPLRERPRISMLPTPP